jgi:hypothetical protein
MAETIWQEGPTGPTVCTFVPGNGVLPGLAVWLSASIRAIALPVSILWIHSKDQTGAQGWRLPGFLMQASLRQAAAARQACGANAWSTGQ